MSNELKKENIMRFLWLCTKFLLVFAAIFATSPLHATASGNLELYLAVNGNDNNDGKTPRTPLRTLEAVQRRLVEMSKDKLPSNVTVQILPGTYRNVNLQWDFPYPNLQVSLNADSSSSKSKPVIFDGSDGKSKQFFKFNPADSNQPDIASTMRFKFSNITIQYYCEGISLGDVKGRVASEGHIIEKVTFKNIGSKYDSRMRTRSDGKTLPVGDCVAGVRLSATSRTSIINNIFTNIENLPQSQTYYKKYGPRLLHAIYISNKSIGNRIIDNSFDGFTGPPIRIRNQSDDTVVNDNTFERAIVLEGATNKIFAVSEWYCTVESKACIEKAKAGQLECPSKNTSIGQNRIGQNIGLFADESKSKNSTCNYINK